MRVEDPTDRLERELLSCDASLIAGIDEVGRGAWAGPVSVGIAVVDAMALGRLPIGIRDSKMLSPKRRQVLFPLIADAVTAYAVGHASPLECDEFGMTKAQQLATCRALRALPNQPDAIVVDGIVNFTDVPNARLIAGADRTVRIVAAASILAKVTRDQMMIEYHHRFPTYGFAQNKGYPSPQHIDALRLHGMTELHRASWSFAERFVFPQ